jgi:hypothetical protein
MSAERSNDDAHNELHFPQFSPEEKVVCQEAANTGGHEGNNVPTTELSGRAIADNTSAAW